MAGTAIVFRREDALPGAVGFLEVLMNNMRLIVTDLETLRAGGAGGALVNELATDMGTVATWEAEVAADHAIGITHSTELDADNDTHSNYLSYLNEETGVLSGDYTMAETAAVTVLGAGRIRYKIAGVEYEGVLDTTITLVDNTVVTGSNFKAWRVSITPAGAVITLGVTGSAGQATEQLALLHLGSVAIAANECIIGYFVIQAATGFTPNTNNTDGEAATTIYYERLPRNRDSALNAALGSATLIADGLATYNHGTVDARAQGFNLAQIAADTTADLTDADTITTTNAGGWLSLIDLAGTALITLSSDGVPGVTALTDTDAAGAVTALDLVAAQLPSMFVPVAYITVVTSNAATFTAKTTLWDATDVASVVVDQTLGTYDRTVSAATFLARKANPPAVPASVTAPLVATLSATAVVAPTETAVTEVTAALLTAKNQTLSGANRN